MRILLITDEWNARRERDLIHRIEIGLMADADRVLYAHPNSLNDNQVGPFVCHIPYEANGTILTTQLRARQLLANLRSAYPDLAISNDPSLLDVVHAFGHRSWRIARAIASNLNAALCVELNSVRAIERAGALVRHARRSRNSPPSLCFTVGDEALYKAAETRLPNARIRLTPWGVYESETHATRAPTTRKSVVVMADP